MCGIVGFSTISNRSEQYPAIIVGMLEFIEHRGPDERGYYFDEQVALGAVRLSIIDLQAGQQPMSDTNKRYWIVYNGEIYNHKELREELQNLGYQCQTNSDTEVVLYAWIVWGSNAFTRFNGAYAFAIYDRLEGTIVLARDRYGKRPLFYHHDQNGLIFSSEIKGFLAYPAIEFSFAPERVASIFTLWTPLPTETAFKNIKQVPISAYLIVRDNQIQMYEYDSLNFLLDLFTGDEEEAAFRVREKLAESVKLRLRSDVAVGSYLSGGLDSAITTLLAVEQGTNLLNTFSVSFVEKDLDESSKQLLLSQYLGTNHTILTVRNEDIAQAFPEAVWHAEMPLFRTALVPMLLLAKKVKEQGVKVVLTGEGSDESFLGYDIFKETLLRHSWHQNIIDRYNIISNLHPYLNHYKEENHNILFGVYNQFLREIEAGLFSHEMRYYNSRFSLRLLKNANDSLKNLKQLLKEIRFQYDNFNPIQKAQWLEFNTLLAGYLLSSQGDRMSHAYGVETRCPFLDFNIVKFAASLPQEFKLKNGINEKYILKKAFASKLPTSIINQPKQPYLAPDAVAFLVYKPDYLEAIFAESELRKLEFIDIDFCQKFIRKISNCPNQVSPRENQAFIQILSLSLLHRFFIQKNFYVKNQSLSKFVKKIDGRSQLE